MMWFIKPSPVSIPYLLQMLKWMALVPAVPGFPLMDMMAYSTEKMSMQLLYVKWERTVRLLNFFSAFVCDRWQLFFKAKEFKDVGYSDTGWKVVEEQDNEIVAPLQNISRKVMLSVEDTGRPTYVVIDFMRRIFPVNAGTVVVPYYPVKNDMILVQGDDEDSFWKAHVIKYNLKQKTLTVRFFMKRAGDNIWVPENTRAQHVHLDSVIGIDFEGTWANHYTHWEEY